MFFLFYHCHRRLLLKLFVVVYVIIIIFLLLFFATLGGSCSAAGDVLRGSTITAVSNTLDYIIQRLQDAANMPTMHIDILDIIAGVQNMPLEHVPVLRWQPFHVPNNWEKNTSSYKLQWHKMEQEA